MGGCTWALCVYCTIWHKELEYQWFSYLGGVLKPSPPPTPFHRYRGTGGIVLLFLSSLFTLRLSLWCFCLAPCQPSRQLDNGSWTLVYRLDLRLQTGLPSLSHDAAQNPFSENRSFAEKTTRPFQIPKSRSFLPLAGITLAIQNGK